ncbi:hypothetical protein DMU17_00115 [Salmonella enterica]|nr:hypothetical protein [Salmonella enterica]EBK4508216.1 hypothetical protein [Salmonella enterica]EBO5438427.1 hypothetical protein [Salmonella enterica]ECE6269129.1 hypothetical protein [Salmonella enterica subsp. diarizonae]
MATLVPPSHVLMYAPGDSLPCRVIRPFGLTPSGPAQALFKTRCVLSCNSNYFVYRRFDAVKKQGGGQ